MSDFQKYLNKQLENPKFKKELNLLEAEFDIVRQMLDIRRERNMTQAKLSRITGITQADISRIENGTRNPSLAPLKRLVSGIGKRLKIEFV